MSSNLKRRKKPNSTNSFDIHYSLAMRESSPSEINTMLKSKITFYYYYCGNNEIAKGEFRSEKLYAWNHTLLIAHIVSYLVPCSVIHCIHCIHFKLIKIGKRSTHPNSQQLTKLNDYFIMIGHQWLGFNLQSSKRKKIIRWMQCISELTLAFYYSSDRFFLFIFFCVYEFLVE